MKHTLTVLLMILTLSGCSRTAEQLQQTELRGNAIVQALEEYKKSKSQYPDDLKGLVPEYISEIPLPVWGLDEWIYEVEKEGFHLEVHESKRTGDGNSHWHRYDYKNKRWVGGD